MPEGQLSGYWAFRRKSEAMVGLGGIKLVKPWMTVRHATCPKRMQSEKLTGGLVRARNLKNNGVEGMVWGLGAEEPLREEYPGNSEGKETA